MGDADDSSPFPVRLSRHRSKGRRLVATAALPEGAIALRCVALALVPSDDQQSTRCSLCLCPCDVACPGGCGSVCCDACLGRFATHSDECTSLLVLKTIRREGLADSGALRLLLRLVYLRAATEARPPPSCPVGDAVGDAPESVDELVSHWDDLSDDQTQHALALADAARRCLVGRARMSREALAKLAATLFCNSFDVVDAETGASLGEGLWPSAAVGFNHSCDPSCDFVFEEGNSGAMAFRCLRPVAAGEELTIAYCSLFTCTTKRRAHLRSVYHFVCKCNRCTKRGRDAARVSDVNKLALSMRSAGAAADRPAAARHAEQLEMIVAEMVATGNAWARLTLARARWIQAQAKGLRRCDAIVPELVQLLGERHPFVARAKGLQ